MPEHTYIVEKPVAYRRYLISLQKAATLDGLVFPDRLRTLTEAFLPRDPDNWLAGFTTTAKSRKGGQVIAKAVKADGSPMLAPAASPGNSHHWSPVYRVDREALRAQIAATAMYAIPGDLIGVGGLEDLAGGHQEPPAALSAPTSAETDWEPIPLF